MRRRIAATEVMLAVANREIRAAFPNVREMWALWRTKQALVARRSAAARALALTEGNVPGRRVTAG